MNDNKPDQIFYRKATASVGITFVGEPVIVIIFDVPAARGLPAEIIYHLLDQGGQVTHALVERLKYYTQGDNSRDAIRFLLPQQPQNIHAQSISVSLGAKDAMVLSQELRHVASLFLPHYSNTNRDSFPLVL